MDSCQLRIRVTPRAKRDEVVGERGDLVAIKLTAPPVKGAANKALLAFLSRRLDLPQHCLAIAGGETSREKRVEIRGLGADEARRRLLSEG
jgi:uncharacterized protein